GNESADRPRKAAWPLILEAEYKNDPGGEGGRYLQAALALALKELGGRFTLDLQVPGRTYGTIPFDAILFHWADATPPGAVSQRLAGIGTLLVRIDAEQVETPAEKLAK